MKKRRFVNCIFAALYICCIFMLTGCDMSIIAPPIKDVVLGDALVKESTGHPTLQEEPTPDNQMDKEALQAENMSENGKIYDSDGEELVRSLLTGKLEKISKRQKRPLAVMFNNIKEGCPQSGIGQAGVVYEAPVEGRITRLMGLFETYDSIPEKIGSVRSSRDYFVFLSMEFDAIYAHFGQATIYVGDLLNSDMVDNISGAVSGIDNPASKAFYRTNDRKAPHNVYLGKEGFLQEMERFNYRTTLAEDVTDKFTFPEIGKRAEYEGYKDATVIYPGGKEKGKANGYSSVQARFEYNPEDKKYYRYEYGSPQIDKEDGQQLCYDNVIFQYCHGEVRDSNDYLAFGMHGDWNYDVKVFTNGKEIDGVWSRTGDTLHCPTQYKDLQGNPICINEGKTWICIIWDEFKEDVVIE